MSKELGGETMDWLSKIVGSYPTPNKFLLRCEFLARWVTTFDNSMQLGKAIDYAENVYNRCVIF